MDTIIVYGSLNIDLVYGLDHIVRPGETVSSRSLERFFGGKGLNQSVAAVRAGASVLHAGCIGRDGEDIRAFLEEEGVDCSLLHTSDDHGTGHALIQLDSRGQNAIVLEGGSNRAIPELLYKELRRQINSANLLIMQNEVDGNDRVMRMAKDLGASIVFNPAPMDEDVYKLPLELVDYLVVNEHESADLSGESDPERALAVFSERYPGQKAIITLGPEGAVFADEAGKMVQVPAWPGDPVDTTAAGDTFIGYFSAALLEGAGLKEAVETASKASAITITRKGASPSIPYRREIG